jgi:hypothetical protein
MAVSPDSEFPIEALTASAGGEVRFKVTNPSKEKANVQCTIDALGPGGGSVMTGTYDAFQPDGTKYKSDLYAAPMAINAGQTRDLTVNLRLSAEAARFEANCWKVVGSGA